MRKRIESDPSQQQPPKKVVVDLGNAGSALCTNQNGSLLAAVGRRLFKIYRVGTQQYDMIFNIRDLPQKLLNLNFSSNDIQWNPKEDAQLASAPTNGSVALWDLNNKTKSKIAYVYEGTHQRAVNRLCFHPRDPHILLTGSQDHTMACLDTRQRSVISTYSGPDSVRDIKYHHLSDHLFAAAFDNGLLQMWDRRQKNSPLRQISAHSGPVYCCSWHLENEHRIVSAGRDKMIKVYDIQSGRPREVYSIHALFSVARVRWRPGHINHITSCSHFLDNVVAVWDVRRPFIPFAAFSDHSDDVTDFLWLSEDVLLSISKDCKLIQHLISEAEHPTERATPVSLSLRPDGDIAQSCKSTSGRSKAFSSSSSSRNPMHFRKPEADPYQESFLLHTSSLQEHHITANPQQQAWVKQFVACAERFKLCGLPVDQLCDHNYKVCQDVGKKDSSQTWLLLKHLYCGSDPNCSPLGLLPVKPNKDPPCDAYQGESSSEALLSEQGLDSTDGGALDNSHQSSMKETSSKTTKPMQGSEVDTDGDINITGMLEFFECKETDSDSSTSGSVSQPQQDWELPKEPFQLRQDLGNSSREPTVDNISESTSQSGGLGMTVSSSQPESPHPLQPQKLPSLPPSWDFSKVILQMLKHYAERGDVQMSVTVVSVLWEKIHDSLPEAMMVQWFMSYIDLLTQYELTTIAAEVTKLCPLSEVNQINQQSTTFPIGCAKCSRILNKHSTTCQKCEKKLNICSVCHCPVRGLFSWCEMCGHGGHLLHLKEWFGQHNWCPSGCGHTCMT